MTNTFTLRFNDGKQRKLPKPAIMGIINASPDSFFNPHVTLDDALYTAADMQAKGAHILDVGGEATNPAVDIATVALSAQQQMDRVVPLVEALKQRFDIVLSIDTSCPRVMTEAVKKGADIINDQRALSTDGAMKTVAQLQTPIYLMHFTAPQCVSQRSRSPNQLLQSIKSDLVEIIHKCGQHGIMRDKLIIDPGFGQGNFGKTCRENYYLLANLREFIAMGLPVLVGWSRKSMIGDVLGKVSPQQRLFGSVAAETIALLNGAAVIRTHDVQAAVDASKVVECVMECGPTGDS